MRSVSPLVLRHGSRAQDPFYRFRVQCFGYRLLVRGSSAMSGIRDEGGTDGGYKPTPVKYLCRSVQQPQSQYVLYRLLQCPGAGRSNKQQRPTTRPNLVTRGLSRTYLFSVVCSSVRSEEPRSAHPEGELCAARSAAGREEPVSRRSRRAARRPCGC